MMTATFDALQRRTILARLPGAEKHESIDTIGLLISVDGCGPALQASRRLLTPAWGGFRSQSRILA
jgi:hypothetical protein